MIEVTYDGDYPCSCMGTLVIVKDGKEIYNKKYCCNSTGEVRFSTDYADVEVIDGELLWEDADKFPEDVKEAVAEVLSGVIVCCGGCI